MKIDPITLYTLSQTSEVQKAQQIQSQELNEEQRIESFKKYHLPSLVMSKGEYKALLEKRPLIKYRAVRNILIKKADQQFLADQLGINPTDVSSYIDNIIDNVAKTRIPQYIPANNEFAKKVKIAPGILEPYIYKHGTKDQVINWFEYRLSDVKTALQELYKTLDDNAGGVYDYFSLPKHFLDNKNIEKMDKIVTTSMGNAQKAGYISKDQNVEACRWALQQINEIQNNSVIRRAVKFVYRNC
ncbi:MAG: hypothetical protein PHV37_09645 [Candidatus Gastranaerophilales bacterium]|nr:hypothetical protein [Candidatus Gastranaerophilales bacterium]